MTPKEYFEMIKAFVDQQYSNIEEDNIVWTPSESELARKIKHIPKHKGTCVLTEAKRNEIRESLLKNSTIKVGSFNMYLTEGAEETLSFRLMEERTRTPSGAPCKMEYDINHKDKRFCKCSWISYNGKNVPIDVAVEIVKWLQAVTKLSSFL